MDRKWLGGVFYLFLGGSWGGGRSRDHEDISFPMSYRDTVSFTYVYLCKWGFCSLRYMAEPQTAPRYCNGALYLLYISSSTHPKAALILFKILRQKNKLHFIGASPTKKLAKPTPIFPRASAVRHKEWFIFSMQLTQTPFWLKAPPVVPPLLV